jgi:hypothetical protein
VDVSAGGGSVTDVGAGEGGMVDGAGVAGIPVSVTACEGTGVLGLGVRDAGRRVLIAVRKTGVTVVTGVPVPVSGHGCKATGNNKQLEASEQIFKLKLVDCAPLQTNTRLPFTTSAVRQVTGVLVSTSKIAESGKIKTACARSFTQN